MARIARSVYVARLRRAFLMRAHPDRFRSRDETLRRTQGVLLQALGERMAAEDFRDYTSHTATTAEARHNHHQHQHHAAPLPYVLEKRDGSLLEKTLRLDDTVENILKHLAKALEESGAASLPPPPPADDPPMNPPGVGADGLHWADHHHGSHRRGVGGLDHRFDVNTTRGKDLAAFVGSLSVGDVEERRASRTNAAAAALVARRLYSFQAIDGIAMGWSSESFAVLLRSLVRLHEEHSSRFKVDSFYPLRLVFSHHEDFLESPLDVYGGTLYLHPAATQLEMLDVLRRVTDEKLEEFRFHRAGMVERTALLQNHLGARISKGLSCSSEEYHSFLERLEALLLELRERHHHPNGEDPSPPQTSLEPERVRLVVESPAACRRARATRDGRIQAHSGMGLDELGAAVHRWSDQARSRRAEDQRQRERCRRAVEEAQFRIGLGRVYRLGVLNHAEFLDSLSRMIEQRSELRGRLAGYSIGIAPSGQHCHIGDDGSLVVPHDWT